MHLKIKKDNLFLPAVIVLLLFLNILGYYILPKQEQKQVVQPVTELLAESTLDYEIKVNRDTILWAAGEIMQKDMPLYFHALEPHILIYPTVEVKEAFAGTVSAEISLESRGRNKAVYWSKLLESRQSEISVDKEETLSPMEINVPEILETADEIMKDLEFRSGDRYLLIALQYDLDGEILKHEISFLLDSNGIVPPPGDTLSASKKTVEEREEKVVESRTMRNYLGCVYFWLYIGATVLLIVSVVFVYRPDKKDEYLKYEKWVSRASLTLEKEPDASFDTLRELIEMAVELDKKVIYDPSQDAYYILDGDIVYVHKRVV